MQDKPDILTEGRPVITIEQIAEPGQPAWWQAAFRDHHGFGPDPVAALDRRSEFGIKAGSQ